MSSKAVACCIYSNVTVKEPASKHKSDYSSTYILKDITQSCSGRRPSINQRPYFLNNRHIEKRFHYKNIYLLCVGNKIIGQRNKENVIRTIQQ